MLGSTWAGKGEREKKNMLIVVESVLVCHLFIFVVVRNDTGGRKTVGRGCVAVRVKWW